MFTACPSCRFVAIEEGKTNVQEWKEEKGERGKGKKQQQEDSYIERQLRMWMAKMYV